MGQTAGRLGPWRNNASPSLQGAALVLGTPRNRKSMEQRPLGPQGGNRSPERPKLAQPARALAAPVPFSSLAASRPCEGQWEVQLGRRRVHGWHMGGTWVVHGWYMGGTWVAHGWYMGGTWVAHGWYMGGTWVVHGGGTWGWYMGAPGRLRAPQSPGLASAGLCWGPQLHNQKD